GRFNTPIAYPSGHIGRPTPSSSKTYLIDSNSFNKNKPAKLSHTICLSRCKQSIRAISATVKTLIAFFVYKRIIAPV
ncbi:MAG: hypothetical protein AAAB16_11000, partial [Pseudomonas sp.]|uniref:hypothetical protein n=1 Tax=Pseudomonas sp. TaxID=306 RepID=UPI0030F31762